MKVFANTSIFNYQKYGGISRYVQMLLNEARKLDVNLEYHQYKDFNQNCILNDKLKYFVAKISSSKPNSICHLFYYDRDKLFCDKKVVTVYDMIYEKFPQYFAKNNSTFRFIEQKRNCIINADRVICISNNTKLDLMEIYKLDPRKISVIPLGVSDIKIENNTNILLPDKPYIIYVGSRTKYKNFSIILSSAVEIWKKFKLNIVVVGKKFSIDELDSIKKHGIHNLLIYSELNYNDIYYLISKSTALIYPSFYEGFGLPILEAMMLKVKLLCSDIPTNHEIGGSFANYFNPHNKNEFINSLGQVLNFKTDANYFDEAYDYAKSFSWEKVAIQTNKIYQSL